MEPIKQQLDSIVAGLKLADRLSGVTFVREYGSEAAPSPVIKFTAVVCVADMQVAKNFIGGYVSSSLKGESCKADVQIRLYAPADENGSGLTETAGKILTELKNADTDGVITNSEAGSIEFDPDMNAVYRTVSFTMEFCVCEE